MKSKSFSKKLQFAGLALVAATSVALATVSFDSSTGTGFVGKGDVQTAFGWNNPALQSNASGVSFSYINHSRLDFDCTWDTVTGGPNPQVIHHSVDHFFVTSVNAKVAYDARTHKQIDGFTLTGFGQITSITQGGPPNTNTDDPSQMCAGWHGTGSFAVNIVESDVSRGLFVNYGGSSVQIN